jgi:hypothetical protein
MLTKFILVASGSIITPKLDINVWEDFAPNARTTAEKMVAKLALAGYFQFTLYDVQDENNHKTIATFTVEVPAPVVSMKIKGE